MSSIYKCASILLRNELQTLAVPDDPKVAKRRRFFPRKRLLDLLDPPDGEREKAQNALRCRCDNCQPYINHINSNIDPIHHMDVIFGDERGSNDSLLTIFALLVYIRCPLLITGFIETRQTDAWLVSRMIASDRVEGDLAASVWKKYHELDRYGCTAIASEFRDAMF